MTSRVAVAGRRRVIAALGIVQVLAWGSSYYLLAVLAGPISRDTGWPYARVVGGVSLGLLVAGLVSVQVGRRIEARGGRGVLGASAIFLAAGLTAMAAAPTLPLYLAAWLLIGAGMGAGLYDAAFGRSAGSMAPHRAQRRPQGRHDALPGEQDRLRRLPAEAAPHAE